jgi:signal transduction histidine kinase
MGTVPNVENHDDTAKEAGASSVSPLYETYRMAQVGRCVNGVAHDINNFLGVAMAYAELVGLDRGLAPDSVRMLGDVDQAIRRCGELVSGITAIARPLKPRRSIVDPAGIAATALRLREYLLKIHQIAVESELAPGRVSIVADAVLFQLSLVYLLMNAQEAVEDNEDRRVAVRMEVMPDKVALTVWDSGAGVPDTLHEQIFEPGMTTKGDSHLGYGLTFARTFAREHDGDLVYNPERGFVLTLPRGSADSLE